MNAVAGGGTFFTFPALIFTGVPLIFSQATTAVALLPGGIASVGAYRRELAKVRRGQTIVLISASLVGGILGANLLLHTKQEVFARLVPFLLLAATLLFIFSNRITAALHSHTADKKQQSIVSLIGTSILQLVIATYGGYFSGGQSILILMALGLMGMENIHEMNALKTLLSSCVSLLAVITFIIGRVVSWPQALLMAVGAIIGGYGGASLARKIDPRYVRIFVICVGVILTIYFFAQLL